MIFLETRNHDDIEGEDSTCSHDIVIVLFGNKTIPVPVLQYG